MRAMTYDEWIAWYFSYDEFEISINYGSQETKEMYQLFLADL